MLRDDRLGFSRWLQISVSLQLKAFPRIGGAAASALAGSTVVEFTGQNVKNRRCVATRRSPRERWRD